MRYAAQRLRNHYHDGEKGPQRVSCGSGVLLVRTVSSTDGQEVRSDRNGIKPAVRVPVVPQPLELPAQVAAAVRAVCAERSARH